MVGMIHQILFSLVESSAGSGAVREVRRRAGVPEDKVFRMDEAYDDAEWRRLLAGTCEVLGITPSQAEQAFADFAGRELLKRWPTWFDMSHSAREFLERHPKIHNTFATAVQDPAARQAIIDKFSVEARANELIVHYRSPNQLCGLYIALAQWVIRHYGDEATVMETRCRRKGDPECEFRICWAERGDG